jgi:hypothetical protein
MAIFVSSIKKIQGIENYKTLRRKYISIAKAYNYFKNKNNRIKQILEYAQLFSTFINKYCLDLCAPGGKNPSAFITLALLLVSITIK